VAHPELLLLLLLKLLGLLLLLLLLLKLLRLLLLLLLLKLLRLLLLLGMLAKLHPVIWVSRHNKAILLHQVPASAHKQCKQPALGDSPLHQLECTQAHCGLLRAQLT
jgi:hypothetical protein